VFCIGLTADWAHADGFFEEVIFDDGPPGQKRQAYDKILRREEKKVMSDSVFQLIVPESRLRNTIQLLIVP
jgi:hypothetical protein